MDAETQTGRVVGACIGGGILFFVTGHPHWGAYLLSAGVGGLVSVTIYVLAPCFGKKKGVAK